MLGENAKKKKEKIVWTDECQVAFDKLKEVLSTAPVLTYTDYSKPFGLVTDASELGLRGTVPTMGTCSRKAAGKCVLSP